ncbi:hypothetical protein BDN67DRAFT_1071160 [Paxillus ammoniavirescens]|nr:hypothetical protein BDN67DRAFT_1071160 [Paxillus ammoniavirescens]
MSTSSPSPNASNTPSVTASAQLNLNYGTVSILVIWAYEYAITFDDEITFLRDSKWSIVKILYLVCRYLMFPFVITNSFHFLQQGLSLEECKSYTGFDFFAVAIIIFCAELMFLVRTYALWHRSRAALIIIIVNFTVFLIPMIVILALFNSAVTIMPVSGVSRCNEVAQTPILVWAYVLLVIGEAEILLSTLYQAVRYHREIEGRNRLLGILVQHNIFYFCCSLASSVGVVSTIYFITDPYGLLLADLQAIIHGILVTRMHRSLWNSDRKKESPSNLNDVSLSTIHFRSMPQME